MLWPQDRQARQYNFYCYFYGLVKHKENVITHQRQQNIVIGNTPIVVDYNQVDW